MSTYAAGFAAGERQAWRDRSTGVRSVNGDPMRAAQSDAYRRGYVAGYTPRCATWSRPVAPPQAWWEERES